jgi:hypothetical protein
MTYPGGYDPYEHADRLNIEVVYGTLRTANGLILQPRMRRLLERSVLAHELGHVCLGHRESTPRNERQADRFAARHLIRPGDITRVAQQSPDPGAWCVELDVTPHILETYLRDNPPA